MKQNEKVQLALEVVKQGMTGTARAEANKIIENALKPELTSGEVEKKWQQHGEGQVKQPYATYKSIEEIMDLYRRQSEMMSYLRQGVREAENANDKTREWLRDVEKFASNIGAGTVFAYVWLLVLTVAFFIKM
jgi:hypothetical protein